jgi:hypothetical protein
MALPLLIALNSDESLGVFNISPSLVLIFPLLSTSYLNSCTSQLLHTGQQLNAFFGICSRLSSMGFTSKRLLPGILQHTLMRTRLVTSMIAPPPPSISAFWDTIPFPGVQKNNVLLHVHLQRLNTDP